LYATPGTYTIQLTVNDPASCNLTDATSVTINVSGKPVAAFNFNPNPPTENTPINFNNLSVGGVRFKWDFGDGDTLITIRRDTIVQHSFNATQTYNVCLTAYNAAGCDSTVCLPVAAKVVPILDIANAFAPSGNNRTIKVQSFGIRQMNWRIYNRWGVLVFQSTDRNKGWDGTYNGVAQPMDVYTYIIEAVFTDNTKLTKTGDITLLR
ncbi:MAG: PKD domain-containing protein, partial [Chitinophagaceae bacterium]